MSFGPRSTVFPSKGRLIFDGGLNNKFDRTIIQDNESPDCKNVVFDNVSVETRQGITLLNTAQVGSFACDGLYTRHDQNGNQTMVAFYGGDMFTINTTSFTTVAAAQGFMTAGVRVGAAEQENYLFFGNGGVIPHKFNGAEWTRQGVYPPLTAPLTTTAVIAGNLSAGDYRYKVVFVNSNLVESDVSPASTTLTVAVSTTISMTAIPTAATTYGVNARRIYRTAAGGATFKRVATINDNTTTTYQDGLADASLGATAPTDNGVPPNYSTIVYHKDRLFCNDPSNLNFVYYTALGSPYTFPTINFLRIGDNSGEIVKGLAIYNDALLVFCVESTWAVYMPDTDDTTWQVVKLQSAYGSKSPYGLVNYQNQCLFPALRGGKSVGFASLVGSFQGGAVGTASQATVLTVSTAGSDLLSDKIYPTIKDINTTYLANMSGIVFENRAFIAYTSGSNTMNNAVLCFDFSINDLSKQQRFTWVPFTGWNAAQFTIWNQVLYFGSSLADSKIHRCFNGVYNDNGAAIDSYIWTKEFGGDLAQYTNYKDFRFLNILVELSGSYDMGVTYRVDSDNSGGTTLAINLASNGSFWGSMVWGIDVWGAGQVEAEKSIPLGGAAGKRIQFKFDNQNTVNQKFKVLGMNLLYNKKGLR